MRSFMPAYNLIGFDPWVRELMPHAESAMTGQQLLDTTRKRRSEELKGKHFQSFWLKLSRVGSHRHSKKFDRGRSCHEAIYFFAFIYRLI